MSNPLINVSADKLRQAAFIQDEIEKLQSRLEATLSGESVVVKRKVGRPASKKTATKERAKRQISPEGLERIRAAQRKRWAKHKRNKA